MIVEELISPNSIVVIGGSNDIRKPGGKVLHNIINGNFEGELLVVNPKETEVQGVKSLSSIKGLPKVDLAIFAIPAGMIPETMSELANRGTRAFIVLSAGFSEMGEEGRKLESKLVEIVESVGGTLIGPNCIGVITEKYKGVFAGPIPDFDPQGCDFVSASGATAVFILEEAIERGIKFSSIFSVGNSAQIGIEEVLEYWDLNYKQGISSNVKLIYAEQIEKPRKFLQHCASLRQKGCKIAGIKAGRTSAGQRAVSSHTGALAGEDIVVETLFQKAGIIRCEGRLDLVNVAGILLANSPKSNKVAVVTHAGGPGVMLTDTLEAEGLQVPKIEGPFAEELLKYLHFGSSVSNPIDFLATGTAEQLNIILEYVENKFDCVDSCAVIFGTPGLFDVKPVYDVLYKRIKNSQKPIYAILPSIIQAKEAIDYFKSLGGVYFNDEVAFGKALAKVINSTVKSKGRFFDFDDINVNGIRNLLDNETTGFISLQKTFEILNNLNLKVVDTFYARNEKELEDILDKINFPIVMKVVGPIHKTDVKGVATNINNKEDSHKFFSTLIQIPGSESVAIQPMLSGTELFFGCKYEPGLGHLLAFGLGGIFVEVLKDVQLRLAPITDTEAEEMIEKIRGKKILQGYRNLEPINKNTIVEVLLRISKLTEIAPEIVELDINPAFGSNNEIIIVDARIKIQK
ncbi:MAG: acetate--CoA ligase family protein [Ignavibacteria bacterium]|nr:acetate--CoA ligase family protein [Ignavibacteria bacterium]